MQDKVVRLKKIKYSILREREGEYSAAELVEKVQSIYDAAINADTIDISGFEMPTEALGIPLTWTNNNKTITIDGGLYEITDDLSDEVVVSLDDQFLPNALQTNGELFFVNGEVFELRA